MPRVKGPARHTLWGSQRRPGRGRRQRVLAPLDPRRMRRARPPFGREFLRSAWFAYLVALPLGLALVIPLVLLLR